MNVITWFLMRFDKQHSELGIHSKCWWRCEKKKITIPITCLNFCILSCFLGVGLRRRSWFLGFKVCLNFCILSCSLFYFYFVCNCHLLWNFWPENENIFCFLKKRKPLQNGRPKSAHQNRFIRVKHWGSIYQTKSMTLSLTQKITKKNRSSKTGPYKGKNNTSPLLM